MAKFAKLHFLKYSVQCNGQQPSSAERMPINHCMSANGIPLTVKYFPNRSFLVHGSSEAQNIGKVCGIWARAPQGGIYLQGIYHISGADSQTLQAQNLHICEFFHLSGIDSR